MLDAAEPSQDHSESERFLHAAQGEGPLADMDGMELEDTGDRGDDPAVSASILGAPGLLPGQHAPSQHPQVARVTRWEGAPVSLALQPPPELRLQAAPCVAHEVSILVSRIASLPCMTHANPRLERWTRHIIGYTLLVMHGISCPGIPAFPGWSGRMLAVQPRALPPAVLAFRACRIAPSCPAIRPIGKHASAGGMTAPIMRLLLSWRRTTATAQVWCTPAPSHCHAASPEWCQNECDIGLCELAETKPALLTM